MRVMTSGGREMNEGDDMTVKGRRWAKLTAMGRKRCEG